MKSAVVPAARVLAALALLALLAAAIGAAAPGAWLVAPGAAVALLGLTLVDGWRAARLRDIDLHCPTDTELDQPLEVSLLAQFDGSPPHAPQTALEFDTRLGAGGSILFALSGAPRAEAWSGTCELRPVRRGTALLHEMSLRWSGPWGLANRQASLTLERPVRISPDLSPVRSPVLQAFLRDAQFGLVARRVRGEGTQFEALSEYQPGMDRRRIDWKSSARHARLYGRENEAERDNQIVFAFDCGQAMGQPVDGLSRLDRSITAALTLAYVALKGGDRAALFGFADKPELLTAFATDSRGFHRLQTAAAGLGNVSREPNFTLALATLTARLRRRSLIVLFSDFTDPTSAELMVESIGRLVRHHLVIFVTIEDAELTGLTAAEPRRLRDLAAAVVADRLDHQRQLVLRRLRHLGVDVIEAPWPSIGFRLLDRYLAAKRAEAIG
jgi:uncharacterized protein (DUF58 family)